MQKYADTTKVGLYAGRAQVGDDPQLGVFAYGQFAIEFVVFGLFLVLGLFTPVSALLAALFQLNLLVATSGTTEWPGTYIIMCAAAGRDRPSQAGQDARGWTRGSRRRNPHPRLPVY